MIRYLTRNVAKRPLTVVGKTAPAEESTSKPEAQAKGKKSKSKK